MNIQVKVNLIMILKDIENAKKNTVNYIIPFHDHHRQLKSKLN